MINGVLKPTVTATAAMVEENDKAIKTLLNEKEKAIKNSKYWQMYIGASGEGDYKLWYKYTYPNQDPNDDNFLEGIGNDLRFALSKQAYNFKNTVKEWMSEVLQIVFQAASLCIDTLRTFQLIVLAILGPLAFGIAVFDGFQHTLSAWIARYINVFLWLPVANIFGGIIGTIQEKMISIDISQIQEQGDTFFSNTDIAYIAFLIIGIIGYFTVPSVAGFIINAGGGGALGQKATGLFNAVGGGVGKIGFGIAKAGLGRVAEGVSNVMHAPRDFAEGYYSKDKKGSDNYMKDKLSSDQPKKK